MKKLALVSTIFFGSILWSSSAFAQYMYFKGAIGPTMQRPNSFAGGDIDYDVKFLGALTLAGGFQFNPMFSTEVELAVRTVDIDGINKVPWLGDLGSSALMFNANVRAPVYANLYATAGAGIGFMTAELYDALSDEYADGSSLATQFMIGTEAEMTENFSLTFEYKWFNALDLELTGTDGVFREELKYTNGSFLIGGKVSF